MLRIAVTLVFIGSAWLAQAQSGHYFLKHYQPGSDQINYLSFDIHQDPQGILYFANRSGVLQFDGRSWTQIAAQGAVYTLTAGTAGEIYAGGSGGFGRIALNQQNQVSYSSLSDSLPDARNIFGAVSLKDEIFFVNESNIYKVSTNSLKTERLAHSTATQGSYAGIYQIGESIFVDTDNEGIKKLEGNALVAPGILQGSHIVFSEASADGGSFIIATDDNRFHLSRDGAIKEFFPKDIDYLVSNVVANAAWINDHRVAFGTLRGGLIFVDLVTMETVETTNYFTGLPDNEVFALHTDHNLGVWVAHEYGFTRVAPFLPFRTYNHYPGLSGNLLCAQSFGGILYVGTSLGLFALTNREIFGTETYEVMQTIAMASQEKEPEVTVAERKKTRRGFLGFGKKKVEEKAAEPVTAPAKGKKKIRAKVTKERKVLRGVEHMFTQVLGISGKVDQLILVGDRLIGGGVSGVFEIKDLVAVPIMSTPSRTIYYSRNLNQLLVGSYEGEIYTFAKNAQGWTLTEFPDSLSMYTDYFFEDNAENLWICGRDRMFRVGTLDKRILDAEQIPLPYASMDRTVGLAYGQEVYITQNGEFFHYLGFKNSFVKYDSLPGPKKYFAITGSFWFYDGHRWRTIDRRKQGELKTEWLALFPDIRFLAPAEVGKSLWVITAGNELYKFSSDFETGAPQNNPLLLKEVRNDQTPLSPKALKVDERQSALTFEFIQPDYLSLNAVEYHYLVKGLQNTWSEWSTVNNVISFPFLPQGKYSVMVESRDLFGTITKLETIDLKVVPPYWKRPEFFALEFLVFGFLVILSLRLNVSTVRYRYLSQFLSTLTVIMLIQFVQTIASETVAIRSTPVADFFVQVVIALLVLPAENFLRRRMIRAAESPRH